MTHDSFAHTARYVLAGTLFLVALAVAGVPRVSHAAPAGAGMRTVTVTAAHPALPRIIPAGLLAVRLVADASTPYGAGFLRLKPGVSLAQAQQAQGDMFKLRRYATFIGGEVVPANRAATVIVNAGVPGQYAMHIAGKEGDPGRVLTFTVTPPPASVAPPSGSSLTVRLTARSVAGLPAHLRSGQMTLAVTNRASGLRSMQIWRLAGGKTQRDFITAFRGANGSNVPSWMHAAGGMDILSPGQTAWITLRLVPGTYVAECPLADHANGKALVVQGMITTFTVA